MKLPLIARLGSNSPPAPSLADTLTDRAVRFVPLLRCASAFESMKLIVTEPANANLSAAAMPTATALTPLVAAAANVACPVVLSVEFSANARTLLVSDVYETAAPSPVFLLTPTAPATVMTADSSRAVTLIPPVEVNAPTGRVVFVIDDVTLLVSRLTATVPAAPTVPFEMPAAAATETMSPSANEVTPSCPVYDNDEPATVALVVVFSRLTETAAPMPALPP